VSLYACCAAVGGQGWPEDTRAQSTRTSGSSAPPRHDQGIHNLKTDHAYNFVSQ